jgi:cbb3-type cytochrome oxidase maturation protein
VESLYLLIPLSVVLVIAIGVVLVWAVLSGQFEELDDAGKQALDDDPADHPREPPLNR